MERNYSQGSNLSAREGKGPWSPEKHNIDQDILWLKRQNYSQSVYVRPPDMFSGVEINKNFAYIPNLTTYYFGVLHRYDLYTTFSDIEEGLGSDIKDKKSYVRDVQKYMSIPWTQVVIHDPFSFIKSVNRIRITGIREKDNGSIEAVTLLHNLAKTKKRIAVVNCHGDVEYNGDKPELVLKAHRNNIKASTIARQLADDFGPFFTKKYHAVYFNSCNSHDDTSEYGIVEAHKIPVVAHTTVHEADNDYSNPARIFWPK